MTKEEWFKVLLEIDENLPRGDNGKCSLEDVCEVLAKRGYGLERPLEDKGSELKCQHAINFTTDKNFHACRCYMLQQIENTITQLLRENSKKTQQNV